MAKRKSLASASFISDGMQGRMYVLVSDEEDGKER